MFGNWGLNAGVRYKGKVVVKGRKRTIYGLWYVPITKINSKDSPEQADNIEDKLNQKGQETATQATQRQVKFQTTNTQELNTVTHQEPARTINQMRTQGRIEAQNQQIATNAITQVPTMTREELVMYHHQSLGNTPGKMRSLLRVLKRYPDQFVTFP